MWLIHTSQRLLAASRTSLDVRDILQSCVTQIVGAMWNVSTCECSVSTLLLASSLRGAATPDEAEDEAFAESVAQIQELGSEVIALAPRSIDATTITVDNMGAGYDAADHLLALGHQRLAVVAGPSGLYTATERLRGIKRAIADHDAASPVIYPGDFTYEAGRAAAARILAERVRPDGIVGCNDESAIGVVTGLREAGLRVPDDVSVVGIGNTRPARFLDLTTVSIPAYELGAAAARAILSGEVGGRTTILQHRLLPRSTSVRREAT
ncbi:MAG: hypothetical protein KatS3mg082_2882 [Nitrospiraceae bacterium]|nr:MAG: hypothetical protein KatS3mg082_2882 [Nitrospiraceae bacterium]